MKIAKLLFPILAAGAFALAGCGTTVNSVENAQKSGQRNMVSDQRVITSPSLNRRVAIVGVNSAMTPGGLLKVQVELENHTRSLQRFLYRFEWFDANGMRITGAAQAWQTQRIMPRETIIITGIGPTPTATQWQLQLLDTNLPLTQ